MIRFLGKAIMIAAFLLAWHSPASCAGEGRTLYLATTEYPPFYGVGLEKKGVVSHVAVEALRRVGYEASIEIYPFARAVLFVRTGRVDGIVGLWHRKEREEWVAYSQPIVSHEAVLYKRKDRDISFNTFADLKGFTIGIGRGYGTPLQFQEVGLVTEEANSDEMNLKKLNRGRIDLVLISVKAAEYLIDRGPPEFAEELEPVGAILSVEEDYFGASKTVQGYEELIEDFNLGLEILRKDGTFQKILRRHGFATVPQ